MADLPSAHHGSSAAGGGEENKGWKLPFRRTAPQVTRSRISTEFRRLDLLGEGRLNFLSLKSALEMREVEEDDATIRQWLKETDRGGKGYVDFDDYEAIYKEARQGGAPSGIGVTQELKRYGTLDAGVSSPIRSKASALSKQGAATMPATSEAAREAARERKNLLRGYSPSTISTEMDL